MNEVITTDHLVVGSGIAGLSLALKLAKRDRVLVIAKTKLTENNTWYAQGGIASVLDRTDSFEQHAEDTIRAGAGLCHSEVVDTVVRSGPRMVHQLIEWGCRFSQSASSEYHLTREGGHSHRRVIHADDLTGKEVMRALIERVRKEPKITLMENQIAVDLLTTDKHAPDFSGNHCLGAYVLDSRTRKVCQIQSDATYLCAGGHGRVYLYTSNPNTATGDGLAMGWRAGCRVANLEFMQFHPTCLFHHQIKNFLISEAVRGEGAILRNRNGEDFMPRYHVNGSLAPRDVVVRAIDSELKESGDTCVFLDARAMGAEKIAGLFPNIQRVLAGVGLDMAEHMIPVVPAAHYSCGGIVVNEYGQTTISGLYAIGEVACTGLHGANRLASNSLLEALVFADRAAEHAFSRPSGHQRLDVRIPPWQSGRSRDGEDLAFLHQAWDEIRRLMWHYVGIVRSDNRLQRAASRIATLRHDLDEYYWEYQLSPSAVEVRNLALVAWLTIRCAMARKESRGIHYTTDYPYAADELVGQQPVDTVLNN